MSSILRDVSHALDSVGYRGRSMPMNVVIRNHLKVGKCDNGRHLKDTYNVQSFIRRDRNLLRNLVRILRLGRDLSESNSKVDVCSLLRSAGEWSLARSGELSSETVPKIFSSGERLRFWRVACFLGDFDAVGERVAVRDAKRGRESLRSEA